MARVSLEELLKLDLVDLAQYLGLSVVRKGTSRITRCLFHDDKRPSMHLYGPDAKGVPHYHCFVCNAHGDAINLIKEAKDVDFRGAVEELENFTRNTLERKPSAQRGARPTDAKRGLDLVLDVYTSQSKPGQLKKFLNSRDMPLEVAKRAGLVTTSGVGLTTVVPTLDRESVDQLESTSLLRFRRYPAQGVDTTKMDLGSAAYDFFGRPSILFPIRAGDGRLQGFAARLIDPKDGQPKYMYSPGLPKSKHLYGLDRVHAAVQTLPDVPEGEEPRFHVFLVEGLMDVLRIESFGQHGLGLLGNQMSVRAEHKVESEDSQRGRITELASILADKGRYLAVHVFLDGDPPGQNGARRAVHDLVELTSVVRNLEIDVVHIGLHGENKKADPDDILKGLPRKDEALEEFLREHVCSVIDFVVAEEIEVSTEASSLPVVEQIARAWGDLSRLQRDRTLKRARQLLPGHDLTFEPLSETALESGGLTRSEPATEAIESWKKLSATQAAARPWTSATRPSDLLTAIDQSARSHLLSDFPVDAASWERMRAGETAYRHLFQAILNQDGYVQPGMSLLYPRNDGGEPRLKVLPCPDDLVRHTYFMNALLQYETITPCVRYTPTEGIGEEKVRTIWDTKYRGMQSEVVVSFAYQINDASVHGENRALFRNYGRCWDDFNQYVMDRVRNTRQPVLYPARHDVHRYYDEIPWYAVRDVLQPVLEELKKVSNGPVVPGIDEDGEEVAPAGKLLDWLRSQLFNYEYEDPETGAKIKSTSFDTGIPQGPDLSAWVATVVLFPLDGAMQRLVEEINREYGDECAATYARYVDDMVLLAPSPEELRRMETLLVSELRKLRLELSKKTEPVPPAPPDEIFDWLFAGRGIWRSPSQFDLAPAKIEGLDHVRLRLNFGFIDRPEALMLLHSEAVFDGSFTEGDIALILRAASSAPDLKHRDFVNLGRLLWWQLSRASDFEELDHAQVARRFRDSWDGLDALKCNESTNEASDAGRLAKIYPTLVWLEGLERFLNHMARGSRSSTSAAATLKSTQNRYAQLVRDGLCDALRCSVELEYLFLTRKHNLERISHEHLTSALPEQTGAIKPYLWRYTLSNSSTSEQRLNQFNDTAMPCSRPVALFHFITTVLMSAKTEDSCDSKDVLDPWRGRVRELDTNSQGSTNFGSLVQLSLPSDTTDSAGNQKELLLDALKFLLSATPRHMHMRLLSSRTHLVRALLEQTDSQTEKSWTPFTPLPGMEDSAILAHRCTDTGHIQQLATIHDAEDLPPLTRPFDTAALWKSIPHANTDLWTKIGEAKDFDASRFQPAEKWFTNDRSPDEKLKYGAKLFRAIVYATTTGDSHQQENGEGSEPMYSADHVLVRRDRNRMEAMLFAPVVESDIDQQFAYLVRHRGHPERKPIDVSRARLWRAGWVVTDLLDCVDQVQDIHAGRAPVSKEHHEPDSEEALAEEMLVNALAMLTGRKLHSKPATGMKHPRAVDDALDRMKRFAKSENRSARCAILMSMSADVLKMRESRSADHTRSGAAAHTLFRIAPNFVPASQVLLDELAQRSTGAMSPRLQESVWFFVATALDSLRNDTEASESDGAITSLKAMAAACRIRGAVCTMRSLVLGLYAAGDPWRSLVQNLPQLLKDPSAANASLLVTSKDESTEQVALLKSRIEQNFARKQNRPELQLSSITPLGWLVALEVMGAQIPQEFRRALSQIEQYEPDDYPWGDTKKTTDHWADEDSCRRWLGDVVESIGSSKEVQQAKRGGVRWKIDHLPDCRITSESDSTWAIETQGTRSSLRLPCFQRESGYGESPASLRSEDNAAAVSGIWLDNVLVCVEWISDRLRRFIACTIERPDSIEMGGVQPVLATEPELNSPAGLGTGLSSGEPSSFPSLDGDVEPGGLITSLRQRQHDLWKTRRSRHGRHIRVGMLQFFGGLSYDLKHDACLGSIEARRRAILNVVLQAASSLQVDVLLLPEYSVSEGTVAWLKNRLKSHSGEIAIWAGSFRRLSGDVADLDLYHPKKIPERFTAVVPIIEKLSPGSEGLAAHRDANEAEDIDKVIFDFRAKKYPATAMSEIFYPPSDPLLEPLYKVRRTLPERCRPGQRILELVCSEAFFVLGPLNYPLAVNAYGQLFKQFGLVQPDAAQLNGTAQTDAMALAQWMSSGIVSQESGDHAQNAAMGKFPRRTILLVPAHSSRNTDYLQLGRAAFLSSGVTTVLCNAVGTGAKGGSIIVGHESSEARGTLVGPMYPYHGVFPGIDANERIAGPLGDNEEALVVVDIDPDYAIIPKPRPQSLPAPLVMVAHLPLVHYGRPENLDCTPPQHKECALVHFAGPAQNILEQLLNSVHAALKTNPKEQNTTQPHATESAILDSLEKLSKLRRIASEEGAVEPLISEWFEKRCKAYKKNYKSEPVPLPPPAVYDWLLVEHCDDWV